MTAYKRKKNTRQRAGTTHGYGSMKKHRGAGSRGGRGNAGSGKRGDAKKPTFRVKKGFDLGRVGFGKIRLNISTINIVDLQKRIGTLVASGIMTESKGTFKINLADIKTDKLLGSGKISTKFDITTKYASQRAIEKVEAAGGKVTVLFQSVEDGLKSEANEE
jgi:large subunit ribosomal protein L15